MEPVIKVRYKGAILMLIVVSLLARDARSAHLRCEKTPKETYVPKTEGSNGFAVTITGSPRLYRPNQIYTISLRVRKSIYSLKKGL